VYKNVQKVSGIRFRGPRFTLAVLVFVLCLLPVSALFAANPGCDQAITPKGRPLPQEVANLPTIVAEPWLQVDADLKHPGLEGPAFDKEGNLYVCRSSPLDTEQRIVKIAQDKTITTIWQGRSIPVGIAFHKDGRVFAVCLTGEIMIMKPDGTILDTLYPTYNNVPLVVNDLVFDKKGNLFITDFKGYFTNPVGGVYRLDAADDYKKTNLVIANLASPNGISLSPSDVYLWISEPGRNSILRAHITPDGNLVPFAGLTAAYINTGVDAPDSNKVDAAGNVYTGMMGGGRLLVQNKFGVPIANVIVPGREEGKFDMTPNLVIKPGTKEGYLLAAGMAGEGSWIYKFTALAEAEALYSH